MNLIKTETEYRLKSIFFDFIFTILDRNEYQQSLDHRRVLLYRIQTFLPQVYFKVKANKISIECSNLIKLPQLVNATQQLKREFVCCVDDSCEIDEIESLYSFCLSTFGFGTHGCHKIN